MFNKIILFFLLLIILINLFILFNKKKKKKLTVFCSSKDNINSTYIEHIKTLITKIDPNKIEIIIGSRYEGLMGIVSNTFIKNKGTIISVQTSQFLNEDFKDDYVYDNLSDRENKLYELGDEYLILPGGIGTSTELFEVLLRNDINETSKNIYIYNINGFYENILHHIDKLNNENILYGNSIQNLKIHSSTNLNDIVNKINKY